MDLSVIILNYNTRDILRRALAAVFASQTNYQYEVLVADNGSQDGSQEMVRREFPQVKLIKNNANLGFSKGNNAAIKQANGKYILLLNSDTEVADDALDLSVKYLMEHPQVGALGAKLLLPNGELDQATRRKFPNPWNSFLRLFGFKKFSDYNINADIDQESEIDATVGAYIMVPKAVIDKVGMLDEEFFMYGEDLDWCWRIKEAGYKIVYYPKAMVKHYKYGSSQSIPFFIIRQAHEAMRIFYRKHYSTQHNFLLNALVYFGISIRMYLVMLVNIFRNKKSVH